MPGEFQDIERALKVACCAGRLVVVDELTAPLAGAGDLPGTGADTFEDIAVKIGRKHRLRVVCSLIERSGN